MKVKNNANWVDMAYGSLGFRTSSNTGYNDKGTWNPNGSSGSIAGITGTDTINLKTAYTGTTMPVNTYVVEKYDGSTYLFHPDSHKQILGAKIPKWVELSQLIEQLVTIYPQQKWTGWDLFLDDKGWGVIEANFSPSFMGIQTTLNSGIKPIVDDILDNLNLS